MTQHYCRTCKRLVPLAPGTVINDYFTVGVAHVRTLDDHVKTSFPCPDVIVRSYRPVDWQQNLLGMDLGPRCTECVKVNCVQAHEADEHLPSSDWGKPICRCTCHN